MTIDLMCVYRSGLLRRDKTWGVCIEIDLESSPTFHAHSDLHKRDYGGWHEGSSEHAKTKANGIYAYHYTAKKVNKCKWPIAC